MSKVMDLKIALENGGGLFVQDRNGNMSKFDMKPEELEPDKLMGFPKPVVDNFMQIFAATESDTVLTSAVMQDNIRLNLKELRTIADTSRLVRVPTGWITASLGELIEACIEGIMIIQSTAKDDDADDFDCKKSVAELKTLRSNMNVLLTTYAINPRLDDPSFGTITMTPFMDEIEIYTDQLKKVKTRADMLRAAGKLKDILDANEIGYKDISLIKDIFMKMHTATRDATVQAMVVEIVPLVIRLPLEVEAHNMQIAEETDIMAALSDADDGKELKDIARLISRSATETDDILDKLIDQGSVLKEKDRFYHSDHPPKKAKPEKKGEKKKKADGKKDVDEEIPAKDDDVSQRDEHEGGQTDEDGGG